MKGAIMVISIFLNAGNERATIDVVASTLFREAAGEGVEGKKAVASVIWTRTQRNPQNILTVVRARKQFAGWDQRRLTIPDDYPSMNAWRMCQHIATQMVRGEFVPTLDAWYFHDTRLQKPPTDWGKVEFVEEIGKLKFYRQKNLLTPSRGL